MKVEYDSERLNRPMQTPSDSTALDFVKEVLGDSASRWKWAQGLSTCDEKRTLRIETGKLPVRAWEFLVHRLSQAKESLVIKEHLVLPAVGVAAIATTQAQWYKVQYQKQCTALSELVRLAQEAGASVSDQLSTELNEPPVSFADIGLSQMGSTSLRAL